jgi:hypothetical protein
VDERAIFPASEHDSADAASADAFAFADAFAPGMPSWVNRGL